MLKYHLSYFPREIQKSDIIFHFLLCIYILNNSTMSSANTLTIKHQKALQLIKEGHSIRSAEAHTGFSRSEIFRAKKRCEKGDTSFGVSGRPSHMTKDEEALLRKNIVIYREDNGVDASQTTVLSIAQDIINNRPL